MYAKCGSIDKAYELLHALRKIDLIACFAMILGFGINGKVVDSVRLFEEMVNACIYPTLVTYIGLLIAYNHAGFVEKDNKYFNSMKEYGLSPSANHYGIIVDLLGRAGWLEEADELVRSMPMKPHVRVWGALLLTYRLHQNFELGEIATWHCMELEPNSTGYIALLTNIYASVKRWDDAKRLRQVDEDKGLTKTPSCSWIESI